MSCQKGGGRSRINCFGCFTATFEADTPSKKKPYGAHHRYVKNMRLQKDRRKTEGKDFNVESGRELQFVPAVEVYNPESAKLKRLPVEE